MKRLLAAATIIALAISIIPNSYAATPKAGTKCSKAGVTKTYSGKKFTCIKLGKKLYWNNGIKVKVPVIVKNSSTPATCAVVSPSFRLISQTDGTDLGGEILQTFSVVNDSLENVAKDIVLTFKWYKNSTQVHQKKLLIPFLYPAQTLNLGYSDSFQDGKSTYLPSPPPSPTEIVATSTCTSQPFKSEVNMIKASGIVTFNTWAEEGNEGLMVNARGSITNMTTLNFGSSTEYGSSGIAYGVIKDKFGNIVAGFHDQNFSFETGLESNASSVFDAQFFQLLIQGMSRLDIDFFYRFSTVEFVIMPRKLQ